jgi:hypothetical protein
MKQFWLGVLLTTVLHIVWLAYPAGYVVIGLTQLVYVVPLLIYAAVKGKKKLLQGVLVAAGVTFLVNTACFGIVLGSLY